MTNETNNIMLDHIDAIHNMDCIEGMRLLPRECVDLILTDPPFAIEFGAKKPNYNRDGNLVLDGYEEIRAEDYEEFTRRWMTEAVGVLKPSGSMMVCSGWNLLRHIENVAHELGLFQVNHLIWKYQFGVYTTRRFVSSHYHVLYFCRNDGRRKFNTFSRFQKDDRDEAGSLNYRDREDVWIINREYWPGVEKTPTKLPRELVEKILAYCSDEGDLVLDPFLGSGQVAVVSRLNGRHFLGFEIAPPYHEYILRRLSSGTYLPEAGESPVPH